MTVSPRRPCSSAEVRGNGVDAEVRSDVVDAGPPPQVTFARAQTHTPTPNLHHSHASTEALKCAPVRVSKPPGAATVPDPSTITAPVTRSRKRKSQGESTRGNKTCAAASNSKINSLGEGGGSAQKKQRCTGVANIPEYAFEVAAANDYPPWIENALKLVAAVDLGVAWRNLVHAWLAFEGRHGYQEGGRKLGSRGRPGIVADWIRRARNPNYRPVVNLNALEDDFQEWWRILQPEWRIADGRVDLLRGSGDWDALKCSGQNGLVSVAAALFFWGIAASSDGEASIAWTSAVHNVSYTLAEL